MVRNIFLKRNLSINQCKNFIISMNLFADFYKFFECCLSNFVYIFYRPYLIIKKKNNSENVTTQKYDFKRRLCAQTQDLQIFKKLNMSQMNPKSVFHSAAYSVQLPNIAGHSL